MAEEFILLCTNIPAADWRMVVTSTPQVIGRGSESEVRVPKGYPTVSRSHARLWFDRRGAWLCDLGSTAGTRLNGVPLIAGREVNLNHGDRISLGSLELLFIVKSDDDLHVLFDEGSPRDSSQDTKKIPKSTDSVRFQAQHPIDSLTNAELEVVLCIARGITHLEDIGKKLFRSPNTVRTQLNKVFQKLDVHSRDELAGLLKRLNID